MDSQRVRYLFFLAAIVAGAQAVEIYALVRLAATAVEPRSVHPFDGETLATGIFCAFATCVGPSLTLALAGVFIFRRFSLALRCLVLCASAYAALMLLGLLVEYGMARAALEPGYMNCGGHPRLFMFLLAVPFTLGATLAAAAFIPIEAAIRWVSGVKKGG